MIKLSRGQEPSELTEKKSGLFKEYRVSHKPVWREIKTLNRALLEFSFGKCAYCERHIDENTVTLEHFHPRCAAPNEVLDWDNLLPCCKECNHNKGNFDTCKHDFINPCVDEPKNHLHLNLNTMRFDENTNSGKTLNTIKVLKFNDLKGSLYQRRHSIQKHVDITLKILEENYSPDIAERLFEDLLKNTEDVEELSAIYSTCILKSPCYKNLRARMYNDGVFNKEITRLETVAINKCL